MDGGALTDAAAIVGFGAGAIALWTAATRIYQNTRGSRSRTARRLNQLACGQPLDYVVSLFGPPVLSREFHDSMTEYVFYTPHALVQLLADAVSGTARLSITVTDEHFAFRVRDLTFGQADIRLGKSRFWNLLQEQTGQLIRSGAGRVNYVEEHDFGSLGADQSYLFAFNDAGVGDFDHGALQEPERLSSAGGLQSFRSATTINTLTVVGVSAEPGLTALLPHGVDLDYVRVFRPSTSRRRPGAGMTE